MVQEKHLYRMIGVAIGVIVSLIMVAPKGTANALYRFGISMAVGYIFAPFAPIIPLLKGLYGETPDHVLAQGFTVGFICYFILEASVRLLARNEWMTELAREWLRLHATKPKEGEDA